MTFNKQTISLLPNQWIIIESDWFVSLLSSTIENLNLHDTYVPLCFVSYMCVQREEGSSEIEKQKDCTLGIFFPDFFNGITLMVENLTFPNI